MRGFRRPGYPKGTLHSTSLKNLQNSRCWHLNALGFHAQNGDPPVPFIGSPQNKLEPHAFSAQLPETHVQVAGCPCLPFRSEDPSILHPSSQSFPQPRAKGSGSKFPRLAGRRH